MRRWLLGLAVTAMIVLPLTACKTGGVVTFSQLLRQADKYHGKTVTFEAYYFDAFEMSALCGSLQPSSYPEGGLAPAGELIWFAGGLPKPIYDQLQTQGNSASGYPQHFGKLKVTGRFESGGQYGHLGGYKYQITPAEVALLQSGP